MPAFAPAVLATAVALSALGAVVLCVLVVLYGFTPAGEDPPEQANRRLLLTRVGHAVAAACFTATAILIAIVLATPSRALSPGAAPTPGADARVPALGERVAGQETRLAETETRLQELENALRRRDGEPSRTAVEPPTPAPPPPPRPAATKPSPAPLHAAVPAPVNPGPPTLVKPTPPTPVKPSPASSRPIEDMTLSEPPAPAASPSSPRVDPPAPPPAPATPPPTATPVVPPAPATPPPSPVASVPTRAAPSEASRSTPRRGVDLPNKLRDDWREIQRGVDSAGDDFRHAVDNLKRRLFGD